MNISNIFGTAPGPRDLSILNVVARAALIYFALIVILRLGKKRSLSRATPEYKKAVSEIGGQRLLFLTDR
jgi:hypothetical protein